MLSNRCLVGLIEVHIARRKEQNESTCLSCFLSPSRWNILSFKPLLPIAKIQLYRTFSRDVIKFQNPKLKSRESFYPGDINLYLFTSFQVNSVLGLETIGIVAVPGIQMQKKAWKCTGKPGDRRPRRTEPNAEKSIQGESPPTELMARAQ